MLVMIRLPEIPNLSLKVKWKLQCFETLEKHTGTQEILNT